MTFFFNKSGPNDICDSPKFSESIDLSQVRWHIEFNANENEAVRARLKVFNKGTL